ncbi:MAG: type II secretion system minor pseudopilin GspI [Pseudomonadota bacterium]
MRARSRGFTLVEVMVALIIVALTVPALLFTLDQQLDGTAYLRERSLARLVAGNRLTELRLALRGGRESLRGRLTGSEVLAERDWYWQIVTTATEVPEFSRIEIRVSDREGENEGSLFTLVAFLSAERES